MKKILNAKHWQIFVFIFGLPFILDTLVGVIMMSANNQDHISNVKFIINTTFYFFGYSFWLWSVGTGLQKQLPTDVKLNLPRFKILFYCFITYCTLLILFISFDDTIFFVNGHFLQITFTSAVIILIVLFHLFGLFCIFCVLYFVSKTFKTVELGKIANISDFAGEFMLFWLLPFGIWIIQPKINKMMKE
jgi:hypothetical protein